jgi:hypothetical protein
LNYYYFLIPAQTSDFSDTKTRVLDSNQCVQKFSLNFLQPIVLFNDLLKTFHIILFISAIDIVFCGNFFKEYMGSDLNDEIISIFSFDPTFD